MNEKITEEHRALEELEESLKNYRENFFELRKILANFEQIKSIDSFLTQFEKAEERYEKAQINVKRIAQELRQGLRR